jgi:hypothetical protein
MIDLLRPKAAIEGVKKPGRRMPRRLASFWPVHLMFANDLQSSFHRWRAHPLNIAGERLSPVHYLMCADVAAARL